MLLHQFVNGAHEVMHPTAIQKDTTFTKIFVGGLPYHTNDASLRKYFEAFGDIDEAVVITDRQTGKSRGYGFVSRLFSAADFSRYLTRHECGNVRTRKGNRRFLLVTLTDIFIRYK